MRHTRIALAAATVVAALALTACSEPSQGTAERADDKKTADKPVVVEEEHEIPEPELPDTELSVGDTFKYNDGVDVTVTKISAIPYDPSDYLETTPGYGFRVHWTIKNGTKKPLDLEEWYPEAVGATTGGDADMITVDEPASKEMRGRLAAGQTGQYTEEYAIDKEDGKEIMVSISRIDEELDILAEDPNWTGTIK